jgi:PhoD-like phosphatase
MSLITTVVGHTTITTTRILAIFDRAGGRSARLAYCNGATDSVHVLDAPINEAAPYGLVTFQIRGLQGGSVRYGVADYDPAETPPDAQALLDASNRRLRLQPEGPLRIALVSCNDIDSHRFPKGQRGAMWKRLAAVVQRGEVDLVVHAGDQVYADGDPTGWRPEEGRTAAYRHHYVNTWSHPDVAAVMSNCPNVMMWDDHEIYDGWGSNDNDRTDSARARYNCAEQAFREFQVTLNPPEALSDAGFGWVGKYGDVAIIAVDSRSQRHWGSGSVLGKRQLDGLELKLNELAGLGLKHLFIVVGTPVVYVPLIAAEKLAHTFSPGGLDDIRDGWTASKNRDECRRFLMSLLSFAGTSPKTMVTVMGGDIHVGTLASIDTRLGFGPDKLHPRLFQVTASGIARPAPTGTEAFLMSLITNGGRQELFNGDIQGNLMRVNGSDRPYWVNHRNFAVLDPSDGKGGWDRFGNLWVTYHTEQSSDERLQQLLAKG